MSPNDSKLPASHAFVRNLNILLKFVLVYGFGHTRTKDQFVATWIQLQAAVPITVEAEPCPDAEGPQNPRGSAPADPVYAECNFMHLLSAAGVASIDFTEAVTKDDLVRLVRAFSRHSAEPSSLSEKVNFALSGPKGIRINLACAIPDTLPETGMRQAPWGVSALSSAPSKAASNKLGRQQEGPAQRIASERTLGAGGTTARTVSGDEPIEGGRNRTGPVRVSGPGTGSFGIPAGGEPLVGKPGRGAPAVSGTPGTAASVPTIAGRQPIVKPGDDESLAAILKLLQPRSDTVRGDSGDAHPDPAQEKLRQFVEQSREVLRQALSEFTEQKPGAESRPPAPQRQAETPATRPVAGPPKPAESKLGSVAQRIEPPPQRPADKTVTRPAPERPQPQPTQPKLAPSVQKVERTSRGPEARQAAPTLGGNKSAVSKLSSAAQRIEPPPPRIEERQKVPTESAIKAPPAGSPVEANAKTETPPQEFWATVPEKGKRTVLCSREAWCVPALNVKQYVEELLRRGDAKGAEIILKNYASGVQSQELEARRRTATGLAELADVCASAGEEILTFAIHAAGAQLTAEREQPVQGLISTAFLRVAQEAAKRRMFPCILQVLYALDTLEHHDPAFARSFRPGIGLEKSAPDLIEEGLRGGDFPPGLIPVLRRIPRAAGENMVLRFNRAGKKSEWNRLVELARASGEDVISALRDILQTGTAAQAADTVGLLSWVDSSSVERWVPKHLRDWPRTEQDRVMRLLATVGAPKRAPLLTRLLTLLDPVLVPLAIDEIGLGEDTSCAPVLLRIAQGHLLSSADEYVRLKALEALGRLRAQPAAGLLREIAEARHMFHWDHPSELRLAAAQSLAKMDRHWAKEFLPRSGFSAAELSLATLDPKPNSKWLRQRRYSRVRLAEPMAATATAGQGWYQLEIRGLSLSGGIATGDKQLQAGALASLKIGAGAHPIRTLILVRDARTEGLGFEIADIDLEERSRLRKLLLENSALNVHQDHKVVSHSTV